MIGHRTCTGQNHTKNVQNKSLSVNRGRFFLLSIRTQEFLLPDGVLPQMVMLNAARKARIQPYLDADGALEQAAVF